jgi:PAS domain S-box-containing protein
MARRAEAPGNRTALLDAIVRSTDDAIYSIDRNGILTSWNPAAERIFGYSASEAIGQSNHLIIPPDRYDEEELFRRRVAAGESVDHFETVRLRKGGARIELSISLSPIRGADGSIVGMSKIARDISARKRREQDAARLAAIVESSDDAIVTKDLKGIVTSWNRAAERLYGYAAQETIGRHISLIIPPDRIDEELQVLRHVGEGVIVEPFDTIRVRKDGVPIDVSLTVWPIRDAAGATIGVSQIGRDISGRQQADEVRRRLAAIVAASDDAIISKDLNGIIKSWNHGAERIFGYTPEEAIGQSIRMIIPRDREDEETAVLDRIRRGEKVEHFETIRCRKDGTGLPISLSVSPIRNEAGTVIGASKIARDITDRKRAEEKADQEHHRTAFLAQMAEALSKSLDYRKTLKAIAALAVPAIADWCALDVIRDDGEIERLAVVNQDPAKAKVARDIAVRYEDPTLPYSVRQVIRTATPALIPQITDEMISAASHGDRQRIEAIRSLGLISYLCVPIMVSGRASGALALATAESRRRYSNGDLRFAEDLAWRIGLAMENAQSYEELQRANRLKDEFLATLSHELRTPLNAILGYARMVRAGMVSGANLTAAVATIERNATSLNQMVEDVLDVSRIVAGKMRLSVQPIELPLVLHEAVDTVKPAADAKRIRIHTVIDSQVGPISGDPDRLRQIVWNLLSNAVKFTPKEGQIQVRLERINSSVEIIVSDTGIGIPPDFLEHVFERFRQADSGTTREHAGLGLGLSIVRKLAELHGGTVSASSGGPGTGATFRVRLPVMIVHPEAREDKRLHPRQDPKPLVERLPDLSGTHVLAVDDEPDALKLLADILQAAGARVTTARSGAAALDKIGTASPDVLVADLGMPLMDGFELIRRLRESDNQAVRDVPAAALTAYARSEDRARTLQGGFEMHLAKPVDPVELASAVKALARRRHDAH